MKVLAEIPAGASPPLQAGTLRRRDLDAFAGLLAELGGARAVLATGDPVRRRPVAVGLAAAAAASGTRTALLECDLADPGLAEALGLATAPGLHEHLRGEAEPAQILKPVALAGPGSAAALEPLVCVVAGRPATSSALLASEAFREAGARLRAAYELVVFEAPADGIADGSLAALAAQADAILVCQGRADPKPDLPVPVSGLVIKD